MRKGVPDRMDSPEALSRLRAFRLRSTPGRLAIVDLFLSKKCALSYADIEGSLDVTFDRVTVYRTLKTFLNSGLIHKVLDDGGGLKYALCSEACEGLVHNHDHVHFKCIKCGQTSCLSVAIPEVAIPVGYKIREASLLIRGICQKC